MKVEVASDLAYADHCERFYLHLLAYWNLKYRFQFTESGTVTEIIFRNENKLRTKLSGKLNKKLK